MDIKIDGGGQVAFGVPAFCWRDPSGDGNLMQVCKVAGQDMMAITDDAGGFDLHYLNFKTEGFASMEAAKQGAAEFAKHVLEHMIALVGD